jgi:hypothetical protein
MGNPVWQDPNTEVSFSFPVVGWNHPLTTSKQPAQTESLLAEIADVRTRLQKLGGVWQEQEITIINQKDMIKMLCEIKRELEELIQLQRNTIGQLKEIIEHRDDVIKRLMDLLTTSEGDDAGDGAGDD